MSQISLQDLRKQYEFVCIQYAIEFCKKQEMDFNGWVGDEIGSIAYCNDFYFNFSDMVLDVNTDQPKGNIVSWYYENLEVNGKLINYYSFTKGLRVSQIPVN